MKAYLGIDLGTSGVKLLLVAKDGTILGETLKTYPISYPQSGWSEQNPEDWYGAVLEGIRELSAITSEIVGISFGGQMHGLVVLDENDRVIRPAILWNDGRTQEETEYLNEKIGKKKLSDYTANIAFAGFTAPKILWLMKHEPEHFCAIRKIMLPKDYLVYRLCGAFSTDYSDASGMLLLDVKKKCWSKEMCEICGVKESQLPTLHESYEAVGTLYPALAKELGITCSVTIAAGAGDNAAAAVGTGTVGDGACNLSLGTSGTLFISSKHFGVDEQNALHSFCHADGNYHLMGCILSAASCSNWWQEGVLGTTDYATEESGLQAWLGKNNTFFLPYLMGERSPHNDVSARGAFIGLRPDTTRKQMTLAVMEGVAFALRDCLEVAKSNGIKVESTKICGGGAKSKVWRTIIANVMGIAVERVETEQGPSFGAAMLAMVACGEYASVAEAAESIVVVKERILPDPNLKKDYEKKYRLFRKLYPALRDVFREFPTV